MEKSFLAQLERRARFNNLMAVTHGFRIYIGQMKTPGDYFLKDGRRFTSTVYGQEQGIFIDESDRYIRLDLLSAEEYDEKQVKSLLEKYNAKLPTKEDISTITDNVDILNQSLRCIGRIPQRLSANPFDYWFEGYKKSSKNEKRRFLVIEEANPVIPQGVANVESAQHPPFSVDGILLARNMFNEPFRILQSLGKGKYYVLDASCKAFSLRSWDRALNGSIGIEGDCLVVKNPEDTFWENGEQYLNIRVLYFRKITGLYAYEGEKMEKIHYCSDDE